MPNSDKSKKVPEDPDAIETMDVEVRIENDPKETTTPEERGRSRTRKDRTTPTNTRCSSRASSRASTMSGKSDLEVKLMQHPLNEILLPLGAGVRMALDRKEYDWDTRKNVRRATRDMARLETIERSVSGVKKLVNSYTDRHDYPDEPVKLHSKLEDIPPVMEKEKVDKIKDSLKKEFRTVFTNRHDQLCTFLENFVEAVNDHQLDCG